MYFSVVYVTQWFQPVTTMTSNISIHKTLKDTYKIQNTAFIPQKTVYNNQSKQIVQHRNVYVRL